MKTNEFNCQCHYVNCHKTFNEDNGCGVDDAYCSEECILDEMDFENQSAEDHEFGYQEYLREEWNN